MLKESWFLKFKTFQSKDLEGDFDPKEYDKRMSELFNSNYYEECPDEERPEYPGLDEELQIGECIFSFVS